MNYFNRLILIVSVVFVSDSLGKQVTVWKDYTYKETTDSFYKFHYDAVTWLEANQICANEGATLFYPDNGAEAEMIYKWWTSLRNVYKPSYASNFYAFIHIGIVKVNGEWKTVDDKPFYQVYNQWHSGEPTNHDAEDGTAEDCVELCLDMTLNDIKCSGTTSWNRIPFACKKKLEPKNNADCNIDNLNYVYNAVTENCYQFHTKPEKWADAEAICKAEGSYLAVINSQAEANELLNIVANTDTSNIIEEFLKGAVYLGFHNKDGTGWKTVNGITLENSGYSIWGNQQPDGNGREQCGSMFYSGRLNDISCDTKCLFICELEV